MREKANSLGDVEIPRSRRFHSQIMQEKISIPTVHLQGLTDDYYDQGLALVELCDQNLVQTMQYPGGHGIPRDKDILVFRLY